MNSDLDIGLLRSFVAVAQTLSFTRAAERLDRVQSAVSEQIKRLEQIVGARLFERTRRSVRLTKDGEQLLQYAHRLIRLNELALADLGQPGVAGRIRLAVSDTSALFLRPVLTRFADAFPLVQFEILCLRSWEALDALAADDIDVALVTQTCGYSGGQLVRREQLHWAVSASSLAAEQDPLPLAIFGQGCVYRQAALAALETSGRAWRLAYNSPSRDVLQMAVETGLAVTILPESLIGPTLRRLGEADGFPALPPLDILLYQSPPPTSRPIRALTRVIDDVLSLPAPLAA